MCEPSPPPGDGRLVPAENAPALPATGYTAPCAVCGRRLHLSEDELVAALSAPPVCWLCDG